MKLLKTLGDVVEIIPKKNFKKVSEDFNAQRCQDLFCTSCPRSDPVIPTLSLQEREE